MRTDKLTLGFAYLRLSNEEAQGGESSSITNQRMIVQNYCKQNGISLVREFVDDGYSGGNFDRPAFQEMMKQLQQGKANTVITKDLSRLGRDMREASYYAEQFFPEHGIHYIAISDNFDTERENIMAPFLFAMNEVYLRDGSRKVKDVLRSKRENGQYCACPPYGYRKDTKDKHRLAPDEMTAPVVLRIFEQAARGDSSRKIALDLNEDGVIPPLKYRVLYRDEFSEDGAARASDLWSYTTVKRILKNPVYLGHTLLGKSKKVSEPATYRSSPSVPPLMTSTRSPFFGRHAYPPGDASGTLRSSPRLSTPAVLPPMVTVPLSAFVVSCGSSVRRSQPATHIFSYLPQCQLRRLAACGERMQRLAHAERPPHAQPRE